MTNHFCSSFALKNPKFWGCCEPASIWHYFPPLFQSYDSVHRMSYTVAIAFLIFLMYFASQRERQTTKNALINKWINKWNWSKPRTGQVEEESRSINDMLKLASFSLSLAQAGSLLLPPSHMAFVHAGPLIPRTSILGGQRELLLFMSGKTGWVQSKSSV